MNPLAALPGVWVPNHGAACTTASILAGLGALGAHELPDLGAATIALGAGEPYGAPALMDYVTLPWRRAPLDVRVEAMAAAAGLRVRSRSGLVLLGWRVRPGAGEALVANLAWGQEAPGVVGTWGWHLLRPVTYNTGGHSVLLAAVEGREWVVLDSNHEGVQRWPRRGYAVTTTRINLV